MSDLERYHTHGHQGELVGLRIVVVAGEVSGDQRAAEVVRALKAVLLGNVEFRGMGGQALAKAGMELVVDAEKQAGAMGFTELLGSLGKILSSLSKMKQLIATWKPDLLILVDYPDFNLRLATFAKRLGVPVLYYIPPREWAWSSGRIDRINRDIGAVATCFPFEPSFFAKHGCDKASFVGQPFVSEMAALIQQKENIRRKTREQLGIAESSTLIAIFPGSRSKEIQRHMTPMLDALSELRNRYDGLVGCIVSPNQRIAEQVRERIPPDLDIKVLVGQNQEVLASADLGILKSGTCNLEAAFLGLPFVCIYKGSEISVRIAAALLKIREVSLVNILKPGTVRELIQWYLTTDSLVEAVEEILPNKTGQGLRDKDASSEILDEKVYSPQKMRSQFLKIVEELRPPEYGYTAPQLVAKIAVSMIQRQAIKD